MKDGIVRTAPTPCPSLKGGEDEAQYRADIKAAIEFAINEIELIKNRIVFRAEVRLQIGQDRMIGNIFAIVVS